MGGILPASVQVRLNVLEVVSDRAANFRVERQQASVCGLTRSSSARFRPVSANSGFFESRLGGGALWRRAPQSSPSPQQINWTKRAPIFGQLAKHFRLMYVVLR
jgi:hypothetical protein